ncbi:unnamed protein product [Pieris macdunnoughi]|uniref:C2H2-type domain-containing protein n=1 Tax=Pieris macdunnoughi TaxID=345717 RepID=A0A821VYP3_9NEOP|nr:unnamed protein product [Pieris macdunnoughi]
MEELDNEKSEVEFEDSGDNKSSMEISYLDYNELQYTTEADTVCDMCSAEFLDASDLQTHLREVHFKGEQSKCYCTFCLKIFSDVEDFMLHIRNEHLLHLKWCVHCFRLFPNLETKMAHEKKHKYRPKHSIFCSQCNKCFAYDFDISQHEYEEHENSEGVMINHGFSLLSSLLNMNVKSFFGTLPKNYICICKTPCQSMHSYIDHLKRSSCKSYTCDLCCKVYFKKTRLVKHVNTHTLKKKNHSFCLKCNKHFTFRALREHKKTCFLIKCVDCSLDFDTVQELANHKNQAHKETVTLARCKLCERQFVGDVTLTNHVRKVHQHNLHLYKYLCVHCDRVFNHPKLLFGHFFSRHKELSPYTCKICNTQFRIRKKFTLHVRTEHKNVGFVEFDEKFNVYFVEKKSENPFIPQSIYYENLKDDTSEQIDAGVKKKSLNSGARRKIITLQEIQSNSSDSDAPLLKICKKKKSLKRRKKNKFMCKVCNKNCFTLQNFRHHMNLHVKIQPIHCIKCDQSFKSEKALKRHLKEYHKNSKLIETLQKIKDRKKTIVASENPIQPIHDFMITLNKVDPAQSPPAKLHIVKSSKNLSVQNFFETFKPDQTEKVRIESSVTMKLTTERKKMNIVLRKCNFAPLTFEGLKLPQKFVGTAEEPPTVTIKIVEGETGHANLNYGERVYKQADVLTLEADHAYCEEYIYDDNQSNEDFVGEEKTNIPEVAEEIMLSTEEFQPLQQKFTIPDMPEAIKSFRIGTLQAEAPFYKIIKLEDIVQTEQKQNTPEKKVVKLSDGVQLVTVNPLAHLIKEGDIHKKKPNKNYYKPVERDIKEAIKKAMAVRTVNKPRKKVKSKASAKVNILKKDTRKVT